MLSDQGNPGVTGPAVPDTPAGGPTPDPGPSIIPSLIEKIDSSLGVINELLDAMEDLESQREKLMGARAALLVGSTMVAPKDVDRRSAGPAAIEKTAAALARVGRTTQAELTRDTGLSSGTITHALRALTKEDPPKARKTGQSHNGSAEWAWQGDPVRVPVADVGDSVHPGRRAS